MKHFALADAEEVKDWYDHLVKIKSNLELSKEVKQTLGYSRIGHNNV